MERWLENGFDFLNETNRKKFQRYLHETKSKREGSGTSLENIVKRIILESGGVIKKKPKQCKKCGQHKKNQNRKMWRVEISSTKYTQKVWILVNFVNFVISDG